jgi:hypothetical protein
MFDGLKVLWFYETMMDDDNGLMIWKFDGLAVRWANV